MAWSLRMTTVRAGNVPCRVCRPMCGMKIATRETVKSRSDGICECCCGAGRPGGDPSAWHGATDMHHRVSAGVGGKWRPANILHLCRDCHMWITDHPKESYQLGLMVHSTNDPENVLVHRLTGDAVFLSDHLSPPCNRKRKNR